jgi:hypothetical protein
MPPPLPALFSVSDDPAKRTAIHLLARGDYRNQGEAVGMRPPGVLLPDNAPELPSETSNPRTILARWIVDPQNPLTARVMVNRIWEYHFGRGIVATPNDFGRMGERPTHADLLDYLANEFVSSGYSVRHIHRLILLSNAYQQSSAVPEKAEALEKDPDNKLLWRFNRRRLDAEEIRDAMLAVSGELLGAIGGPSEDAGRPRRAIETKVIRNSRDPLLDTFDAPDGYASTGRRNTTTTATQALLLINGAWSLDRAGTLARRLDRLASGSGDDRDRARITLAYRVAYGREPEPDELFQAAAFLSTQARRVSVSSRQRPAGREALVDFCHALLNSNEFLYVD